MGRHGQDSQRRFIAGNYSIADMASYPWIVPWKRHGQDLDHFPNLKRWFEAIGERPATKRAYEKAAEINTAPNINPDSAKILFGQTASNLGAAR